MWRSFCRVVAIIIVTAFVAGCKKNVNKDTENPGISFLYGANAKNDVVLRPSSSTQKITNLLVVNLREEKPAATDIHINIADKTTALVNAYNTAHGTTIEALPAARWSLPAELVIKKGEQYAYGEISVINTSALDFNKQYAIGVTITGVSDGKNIAANLGDVLIVFRVQNELDGVYSANGESYHPGIVNRFVRHQVNVELHTTGPNTVDVSWPVTGYNTPIFDSTGTINNQFTNQQVSLQHNPSSHAIACINSMPTATIVYNNLLQRGPDVYNSRWDSSAKKVYIAWGYNLGPGFSVLTGVSRVWIDTLKYIGPR